MARYEEVNVHGYGEFCQAVSDRKGKDVFVYFSGDKDAEGKSWCPDCVKGKFILNLSLNAFTKCFKYVFVCFSFTAEPVVRGQLTHLPEASVFIYCQVGERA